MQHMHKDCWQKKMLIHAVDGKYKGRPKKR